MADLKISQMPKATVLSGEEVIPIVQNGSNKTADVNLIKKDLATQSWVQDQINEMHKVIVVPTLPETGVLNRIYLVPNDATRPNDIYDEYIWLGPTEKWEFLGNKHVTVDLSPYYTKVETDERYVGKEAGKVLSTNDYTTADKTAVGTITNKVDKVTGKGLSTNDYTTVEKTAVGTIGNKVDKIDGKQLSTEDYTTAEKTKLGGVAASANNYVHPTTAGNKHIPAGGTTGQILINNGDGSATWTDAPVTYDNIEGMCSYGVEWDITVADPTLTRIGNSLLHKSLPIQSAYKGCVVKGTEVQYWLNPNNWSQKADGTPSVLDGTDGTVRVYIPRFYGKSGADGNKRWVKISTVQCDGTWEEIPEMFVDAYRCTVNKTNPDSPKTVSVVNTTIAFRGGGDRAANDTYLDTDAFRSDLGKPSTNIPRTAMRAMATNAGSELMCYEYYKWVFYWNWVIEYATFNSQATYNANLTSDGYHQGGLGDGITTWDSNWSTYNGYYPITPCGYGNSIGNFTGLKDLVIPAGAVPTKTFKMPRWRGFDNPFGDIWTNLDGIVLKRTAADQPSNVYTTTDPTHFDDSLDNKTIAGVEIASDGYTKAYDLGEKAEIIPSAVGGSTTTYMCDYHYCNAGSLETRTLLVGGYADNGALAGLGYFNSAYGVGLSHTDVGFRTINKI